MADFLKTALAHSEQVIQGNSLFDWAVAALVAAGVWMALAIVRRLIASRYKRYATADHPTPVRLACDHPADAVLGAALHLHYMRHRVMRPAVAPVERERPPPSLLRTIIVADIFQAQRRAFPRAAHKAAFRVTTLEAHAQSGRAIPAHGRGRNQSDVRSAGPKNHADRTCYASRAVVPPLTIRHRAETRRLRPAMPPRVHGHSAGTVQDCDCCIASRRLGHQPQQDRLGKMRRHEFGRLDDRRIKQCERIATIDAESLYRCIEFFDRRAGGTGDRITVPVFHLIPRFVKRSAPRNSTSNDATDRLAEIFRSAGMASLVAFFSRSRDSGVSLWPLCTSPFVTALI